MNERSFSQSSTRVLVIVTGVVSFLCGLIIGLPVLGWGLWPVQWTDIPQTPLATYTPYPTYTPFPTATLPPVPPSPTPGPDAIVVAPTLNVMDGPGENYPVTGQVIQAEEVRVMGQYASCQWLKVTTPAQMTGWITGDSSALHLQVPCDAIPQGTFRPTSGNLKIPASSGEGRLTVENGTSSDGVVALAPSINPSEAIMAAYVRSGETYELVGIPDGVYVLFFATGSEWNGDEGRFTMDAQFQRFDDTFEYTTTSLNYTIWEITLHPVSGGTARTDEVPPDQFPTIK